MNKFRQHIVSIASRDCTAYIHRLHEAESAISNDRLNELVDRTTKHYGLNGAERQELERFVCRLSGQLIGDTTLNREEVFDGR